MDESLFSEMKKLPPEVLMAKKWYESQRDLGPIPWVSANSGKTDTFTPEWDKAFFNEDVEYRVTEVHLESEERFMLTTSGCAEKYQKTGDNRYMASDVHLIVRTNKKTGETDGFIIGLYPDLKYLEKHLDQPLKGISYLKRDKEFWGVIYYHNMKGEFVNAWQYIDGTAYALYPEEVETSRMNQVYGRTFVLRVVWHLELLQIMLKHI